MFEKFLVEKFLERLNVLRYGYGYELNNNRKDLRSFLNALCGIPFRSTVHFKLVSINKNNILMKAIIIDTIIPFKVDKRILDNVQIKKIPYRLTTNFDDLEKELASKVNNIMFREINVLDLYDIYMNFTLRKNEIDEKILADNLKCVNYNLIINVNNRETRENWNNYRKASSISFESVILVLEEIVDLLEKVMV